jgi:hypothetical protein
MRSNSRSIASSPGGRRQWERFRRCCVRDIGVLLASLLAPPPGREQAHRVRHAHDAAIVHRGAGSPSPILYYVANLRGEDHTIPLRGVYLIIFYIRNLQYHSEISPTNIEWRESQGDTQLHSCPCVGYNISNKQVLWCFITRLRP